MNKKKNSLFLIVLLLFIAILATLTFLYPKLFRERNLVKITYNGSEYGIYSLSKDSIIEIRIDNFYNKVEIKNNMVDVIESNCANQICVEMYPMSIDNPFPIVCLPHGIVIELIEN